MNVNPPRLLKHHFRQLKQSVAALSSCKAQSFISRQISPFDCKQTTTFAMVQKTSRRGVHSGNTLRAFNSRYSRRYHNQACIIFRARSELLQKLDGETGPKNTDKKTKLSNVAVNVALSLNKQARWLLPSSLIRQIQTNNIADPELTVSVLERHKLKRPASCVSFHSNKGDLKRIQFRNGGYFGFHWRRTDCLSWRALKRERRQKRSEMKKKKKAKLVPGSLVEVFTEQGLAKRNMDLGESELRYEVFYPSPASSSISHNPKYIKQDVNEAFQDSDQHVQNGKAKKQHQRKQRRRMTLKDLEDWELHSSSSHPYHALTTRASVVNQEEFSLLRDVREHGNPTECLLTSLIDKARQLQTRVRGVGKPRRKKSKSSICPEEEKSHVVYVTESQERADEKMSEESLPNVQPPVQSLAQPVSSVPPESTRVLLPKNDVTMTSLKDCFGESYFEAVCQPRKFILDVTASVRELLKKQGIQAKVAENTEEALSYLVCVHDGFYNEEYDVYRVLLNSKLHKGLLTVEIDTEQQDLFKGTVMNLISRTMDFMQKQVTLLKDKKHFPLFLEGETAKMSPRQLSNHLGSSEIYVPSVKRVFQKGSVSSDITMPDLSDLVQEESVFCDICYDDISPMIHGSAPFTSLRKCGHRVCDSCWSQHIHTRLHEGFVRLTCPGYDCQVEVKVGVLLSVAPLDVVDKMLQRQEEVRIGGSQTEKWCPNETCGRVISLQPSSSSAQLQQDVVCACGAHVCFQCLMPAHWPASCKQAEDYRANLSSAVFPDRLTEVHDDSEAEERAKRQEEMKKKSTMVVEGKHCPSCKNFVYKHGGCPQMTCRCGQLFCWFCARPGDSHPDRNCVNETQEKKLTTTILVHHLDVQEPPEDTAKKQPAVPASRRQRVSLMERAAEYRQQREQKQSRSSAIPVLAKSVSKAAAKNQVLSQYITQACSGAFPPPSSFMEPRQGSPARTSKRAFHLSATMLETVTTFLQNTAHSKQELLEVVEYSMVLLKDLPDSLRRRRALRITEDLGAFCSFQQSIFDVWGNSETCQTFPQQEAVRAVMRLAEIQGWIRTALDTHVATFRKLRERGFPKL